ncbi:hypothetical protein CIL03_06025 [Virgibacillus indicus]|uniref:Acyltransferase 3 domain-containing protein n=1 Tax=Virgibacillus indicus TaxID=2024554 RepID=A0A265NCS8_9BACI|nr:acyltransferase [Virgibacillus indicus]OZU89274.1 hypothetical protein CIL03_06025 [Virgibacillus indicus]
MNNRIEQLDSLRGLAALAVVLSHIPYFAFSLPYIVYRVLVWLGFNDGHSSVMLFFLLSGFVLTIPFLKRDRIYYFPYVTKRFFRIYAPYLFAIIFAIILSQTFLNREVSTIGDWNLLWNTSISAQLITDHLLFLGNYHTNAFNGVIWSLTHELRISLIFPFIVLLIKRFNWKFIILICVILSCTSELNTIYSFQESIGYNTDYFKTLQYTSFFMFGSLIAKHKKDLVGLYKKRHILFKCTLLFVSLCLFKFSSFCLYYLYEITGVELLSTHFNAIAEYGVAIGCTGIVISAISSVRLGKILLLKPLLFLGKISYSLYLLHLPIILSCIYLFKEVIPLWSISIIAIFLSFCISTIAWKLIEKPSQKVGRNLAKMIGKKKFVFSLKKKAV